MSPERDHRVGIDIGGTFTDLVLIDDATGERAIGKVLTTPDDPSEAVEEGLRGLLEREEVDASQLKTIIHGTTLVTNALIERRGAPTALLTTEGFRDAVAIGTEHRYDMYDIFLEKPEPLVPRSLRYGIRERVLDDGSVLRELDEATDPWGVKVTRVELRDLIPSKAVQESMELQMSAERRKRASILTSEGERESAVNSARGKAEAQVLDAEARQKAAIMEAEAQQKAIVLKAQAERQQQVLKAQATAEALQIITKTIKSNPDARDALQFLLAQNYLEMGTTIGSSDSSKVMFMDPRSIPATLEGMRSIVGEVGKNNSR